MLIELIFIAILGLATSIGLTFIARLYAFKYQVLDTPNSRSSHVTPKPRGGGIAIVVTYCLFLVGLHLMDKISSALLIVIIPPAIIVAIAGFWDDHSPVSPLKRLFTQFMAIGWVISMIGTELVIYTPFGNLQSAYVAALMVGVFFVWFINLFNFMDGTDGIAATEVIFILLAVTVLASFGEDSEYILLYVILASASSGFLVWNWPPAKIFMGDVGSGFLGVSLASLAYISVYENNAMQWAWLILPAVFIADSTSTLFRRMFTGQAWYQPHRTHAYQRAARRWGHKYVLFGVLAINLLWVLPFAVIASLYPTWGSIIVVVAYTPLIMCSLFLANEDLNHENRAAVDAQVGHRR